MKTEKIISDFSAGFKDFPLVGTKLAELFPSRRIQRVLFILPPDVDESKFNYEAAHRGRCYNYPPYGLGLLARRLLDCGLKTHIVNLNNEVLKACRKTHTEDKFNFNNIWKESLKNAVEAFGPDLIGVSCMFTMTHRSAALVCAELKKQYSKIPVCLGGVHATNCLMFEGSFAKMLADFPGVNFFFIFEAENAFDTFIKVVNAESGVEELCQLFINSNDGKFYFAQKKVPRDKDLDVIPTYELMDIENLSASGVIGSFFCFKEKGDRFASIISNRGCRGSCTFCSVRDFNGPGVRMRSIESIIEELLLLRDKFKIKHLMWLDDDLFFDHKRAVALFNAIEKRVPGITWDCSNGVIAASCTQEVITAASRSGCLGLNIGVESGNPEILRAVKKPSTKAHFLSAARVLKKFENINSRVFLMIGFPNETYKMILDTFDLALELDLDWYNITIFEPLPNTPIIKRQVSLDSAGINFEDTRYNSGPFGRAATKKITASKSLNPFSGRDLDTVPARQDLDQIWFYMNFYLNFKRLLKVQSLIKLKQQYKYVKNITELIAPNDPFPMYFYGYLEHKLTGQIDSALILRLRICLENSPYRQERFAQYKLDVAHLETGKFPDDL
ncbi:MAG: B12-binding domain-containing radical SAM protein [Candidatus Omnitrophica bacterium]|nr:B12-binding domain-containing radical SAM protein [Candidatus Omnitrophota bacterium]